mgnify:CR=1 FL=1
MYEYGNIEDTKPGDIVERIKKGLSNEPYHQIGYLAVVGNDFPESEGCRPSINKEWWKLDKTLAGSEAKVGDTIKVGDLVLVMESMKMENNILAEKDAVVINVHVKAGQTVMQDDVLFDLE